MGLRGSSCLLEPPSECLLEDPNILSLKILAIVGAMGGSVLSRVCASVFWIRLGCEKVKESGVGFCYCCLTSKKTMMV
jgi:hypothetical protein